MPKTENAAQVAVVNPVAEVTRTKEPKVKLTDVILKLIADSTYLDLDQKANLAADIDKVINKVTNAKPSLKNEIRELIFTAGEFGISRDGIFAALTLAYPEVSPYDLALAIYPILQPVNYKPEGKFGWAVKVVAGGNYVWVK